MHYFYYNIFTIFVVTGWRLYHLCVLDQASILVAYEFEFLDFSTYNVDKFSKIQQNEEKKNYAQATHVLH
jgi:hypothetical protein